MAYQVFKETLPYVEYPIAVGGTEFGFSNNVKEDLLSITSVHPLTGDTVKEHLRKAGADRNVITELIRQGSLIKCSIRGKTSSRKKY
jgi:hypothetical protein